MGWAKIVVGILLVPAILFPGLIAVGAAVLGVFLIVVGVKQLRSGSVSQTKTPLTPRRSLTLRIMGWLLVVPLAVALIFGVFAFVSVDPNEETESIQRVMAAVFVILAIPIAWGGWVMIRRGREPSTSTDAVTGGKPLP
jgi:cytochrome bd-type quinol oxidase subunit 1